MAAKHFLEAWYAGAFQSSAGRRADERAEAEVEDTDGLPPHHHLASEPASRLERTPERRRVGT